MGNRVFTQSEAMALMWYQCEKCNKQEQLWNSRPRVTPFIIICKCGGNMKHTRWEEDKFAPNHYPVKGDRIFVDESKDTYEKRIDKALDLRWETADYACIRQQYVTKEAYKAFRLSLWRFGEPTVIEIESIEIDDPCL